MLYKSALHGWRSQPAEGRLKSHTKKHLEFEKNAVNHTTFVVWLTSGLGL